MKRNLFRCLSQRFKLATESKNYNAHHNPTDTKLVFLRYKILVDHSFSCSGTYWKVKRNVGNFFFFRDDNDDEK